jgi:hypothetical protein
MRLLVILLLFTSCALLNSKREIASVDEGQHIIFDLDWTLIAEVPDRSQHPASELVHHAGLSYRITPHTREVIESLMSYPSVKVYAFSGGDRERNEAVLKQIKLSNGKSLYEEFAYIFSKEDLLDLTDQVGTEARFADRYKKDLLKLGFNLDHTILIDDNYMFAKDEVQRNNILWLGDTYKIIEDYGRVLNGEFEGEKYIPQNFTQWKSAKDKLLAVSFVLERGIEQSNLGNTRFPDVVQKEALEIGLHENADKLAGFLSQAAYSRKGCQGLIFDFL